MKGCTGAAVTPPARYPTIDGLRGAAVLGIALMNIVSFGLPAAAYLNPAALGWPAGRDMAVWFATALLIDGKMRALFAMLFGASLLLVAERATTRAQVARLGWLAVIGLAHGWLLWSGDILLLYAIVGLVALGFRRVRVPGLVAAALLALSAQAAIGAMTAQATRSLAAMAEAPDADETVQDDWNEVEAAAGRPSLRLLAHELALHRGDPRLLVEERIAADPAALVQELLLNGPETLGLMLLGMAALRSGFLTGGWRRRHYWLLAAGAYAVGVPAMLAVIAAEAGTGFATPAVVAAAYLWALVPRWLIATGHAALLMAWLSAGLGPLRRRLAAAGRMALTNYLATSLVMTVLFDGWGLGLFGRFDRWQLYLLIPALWLAMLAWSAWWLARFGIGPAEKIWRRLTHAGTKGIANPSQ